MRRFWATFLLLPLVGVVLSACDSFYSFTVVNESDLELVARVSEESCGVESLNRNDIEAEGNVPARGALEYHDTVAYSDGRCLQVYKHNGALVLQEEYEYLGEYFVPSNPMVIGRAELTDSLPDQGWFASLGEEFRRRPVPLLFLWGTAVFFGGGILYGLYLAARALWPRSNGHPPLARS